MARQFIQTKINTIRLLFAAFWGFPAERYIAFIDSVESLHNFITGCPNSNTKDEVLKYLIKNTMFVQNQICGERRKELRKLPEGKPGQMD